MIEGVLDEDLDNNDKTKITDNQATLAENLGRSDFEDKEDFTADNRQRLQL